MHIVGINMRDGPKRVGYVRVASFNSTSAAIAPLWLHKIRYLSILEIPTLLAKTRIVSMLLYTMIACIRFGNLDTVTAADYSRSQKDQSYKY